MNTNWYPKKTKFGIIDLLIFKKREVHASLFCYGFLVDKFFLVVIAVEN